MPSDSPALHQRLVALIKTSGTLLLSSGMPNVLAVIVKDAAAPAHQPCTPPLVQQHA